MSPGRAEVKTGGLPTLAEGGGLRSARVLNHSCFRPYSGTESPVSPNVCGTSSAVNLTYDVYEAANWLVALAHWNTTKAGIDDPGQSRNAITVGAYTEKVFIEDRTLDGWQPIAKSGDLTPTSRTSLPWPDKNRRGWPIKPDIVMEGGNYVRRGNERSDLDDLSLLTTILHRSGRLLEVTRDTSPATALGARFAAII